MNDHRRFQPDSFSIKRVLMLVVIMQVVLGATMYLYWNVFRKDFFPFPMNDDGTVTVEGGPMLVGYGVRIPPPWTFTGVGTDTLRLNGLPYDPMLRQDVVEGLPPAQRDRIRTIKMILEEAENAYKASPNKEEGMGAFAETLESYQGGVLVSVFLDREKEMLTADFGDALPPVTVNFLHKPHWVEPEGLRLKRHYDAMIQFIVWMQETSDGVYSFGQYNMDLNGTPAAREEYANVLDMLDELSRNRRRPPTPDDVRQALASDVYERYEGLINDYLHFHGSMQ